MKVTKIHIQISLFFLILASTIYSSLVLADYYSPAKEKLVKYHDKKVSDTLKIIFIGDSWAAYHSKYDPQLSNILESRLKTPVTVHSLGSVGAKTKAIYTNMFDSISDSGTKREIDLSPDYAIISAGINDAVAKIGTKYYCHHYKLIIRNLLSLNIKPIILDMPQVDYKAVYKKENFIANIRHQITRYITKSPLWDFEDYRKELINMIKQEGIEKRVIYISSSEWNPKGFADPRQLYTEDNIHLNKRGYYLLDSCIASHIYNDIHPIHDFQKQN